jgi:hypothetical protein
MTSAPKRKLEDSSTPVVYFKFNSKSSSAGARALSNFHKSENNVTIGKDTCLTGEHAFHLRKFVYAARDARIAGDTEREKQLTTHANGFRVGSGLYETALAAKRAGGRGKTGLILSPRELTVWNNGRAESTQIRICTWKRNNDPLVSEALRSSVGTVLLHQDNRANSRTVWGAKIERETGEVIGQNRLGEIWMDEGANMVGEEDEAFKAECKRLKTEMFGE